MRRLSLALVHHPVLDRQGAIITTAITNLDLHDIARSACAFGLSDMFVVHPIAAQRELAERVRDHWLYGSGKRRIPDRAPPMKLLRVTPSLDQVYEAMGGRDAIEVWTTSAKKCVDEPCTYAQARKLVHGQGPPVLLFFGTGWGLPRSIIAEADVRIEPIAACVNTGFNHLSVRAACAITLDRLVGQRE